MWTKLKEQLPALTLTLVVVPGAGFGVAWRWFHDKTITGLTAKQEQVFAQLREQHAAGIPIANDESNRRIGHHASRSDLKARRRIHRSSGQREGKRKDAFECH